MPTPGQSAFPGLPDLHKTGAILGRKTHIFLLSHMRSFTSLFGHILGSNPEICGYYEMHIGYHSWKSLVRQKMLYFQQEAPKPRFRYMFDKVLHNEHAIAPAVLNHPRTRTIFSLRHPREVIPSILSLYQKVDPEHEFNSEMGATTYYIQRLAALERIADMLHRDFVYLDAECMKLETQECLDLLSDWLQLNTRLTASYDIQRNTSRKRFGDSSERLRAGRIVNEQSEYVDFVHDRELLARAVCAYDAARARLIRLSARRCVIPSTAHQ